jgi:hypothetical protein
MFTGAATLSPPNPNVLRGDITATMFTGAATLSPPNPNPQWLVVQRFVKKAANRTGWARGDRK